MFKYIRNKSDLIISFEIVILHTTLLNKKRCYLSYQLLFLYAIKDNVNFVYIV